MNAFSFSRCALLVLAVAAWLPALVPLGCATLSEAECRAGNWYDFGHRDALLGEPANRFESHVANCGTYGVAPDRAAYDRGRADGLREYCTPAHGFRAGREGERYRGVCSKDLEAAFLEARGLGQKMRAAQQRASAARTDLEDIDRALRTRNDLSETERQSLALRRAELERRAEVAERERAEAENEARSRGFE